MDKPGDKRVKDDSEVPVVVVVDPDLRVRVDRRRDEGWMRVLVILDELTLLAEGGVRL